MIGTATAYWHRAAILLGALALGACSSSSTPSGNTTNLSPLAAAGPDQSVVELINVTLNASASSDPDGSISGYQWTQVGGPAVTLSNATAAVATFVAPDVNMGTSLIFAVVVTDNRGATSTDQITVFVSDAQSSTPGLDNRPVNTSCVAPDRPTTAAAVALSDAFPNLSAFSQPLALLQAPGDNSTWFVVEKGGQIMRFQNQAGVTTATTFLNISTVVDSSDPEGGLLAMAFHPDFASNGQVFLYYTRVGSPRLNALTRYTSTDGGQTLNPTTETILISFSHPFNNHFGGQLGFDSNGLLYWSMGDGGDGGDPGNRAQTTTNLHGTIMRIDVDGGNPYAIPADNPFAGNALCSGGSGAADCPEIYAWGLRNPWRWSFDSETGDLWLADVGQGAWEEINVIERGGNYGWRFREGAHCFNPSSNCPTAGLIDPVAEIAQPTAQSITGGYVYRGSAIPELSGRYVVGDFITGTLFALFDDGQGSLVPSSILSTGLGIASFAEDLNRELYIVSLNDGRIYRIDRGSSSSNDTVPDQLSATGCVQAGNPALPASGLVPYDINAPFWSDGADKQRWMAIPDNDTIAVNASGDFDYPIGSVLLKHFSRAGQLVESRLFMRHTNGSWGGYSYEWNAAQTEANRVRGGKIAQVAGQDWVFPSETQCLECHTSAAGRTLGPEIAQLNRLLTYPSTGRTDNELNTLSAIGMLNPGLPDVPANLDVLSNPADIGADLTSRARAYLHTNCAQCHRPGGAANVGIDFRYDTALTAMGVCNVVPQAGDLGITGARLILPGDSARSILAERMRRRGCEWDAAAGNAADRCRRRFADRTMD